MKTHTREELSALTQDQLDAMSKQERDNAQKQGRQFLEADRGDLA